MLEHKTVSVCTICGQCAANEEDLSMEPVTSDLSPDVFIQVASQSALVHCFDFGVDFFWFI